MTFLAPLFLLGLLALGVPLLLHLSRRRQAQVVEFPSLMFLGRVPYRSVRRRRIRNWLLLALRCAAYALLAVAFARPLFDLGGGAQASGPGALHRVVAGDRSYSVGYGERWQRTRSALDEALRDLGENDRVSVVSFDSEAALVVEAEADPPALSAAVEGLTPGDGGTRFAPPLKLARGLLVETSTPRRELWLISDFQLAGRPDEPELRLPVGTELRLIDVGGEEPTVNVAVADLTLDRRPGRAREQLAVAARLVNSSERALEGIEVELELNGRVVETRRASVAPDATVTVAFEATPLEAEVATRGSVRARHPEDALAADDRYDFVVSPQQAIDVVLVAGRVRRNQNLYLERALALGDDPRFRVRRIAPGELRVAELPEEGVVILNDTVADLRPEVGEALAERVASGLGLLVILGERWREEGRPGFAQALGVPPSQERRRSSVSGTTITSLDVDHPVLAPFAAPRSGDFSSVRVFQHHVLDPGEARVLARFADASPALVEGEVGEGRVLVWPSTLDTYWSDLPLHPVFLPLVHASVRHLAGFTPPRSWYRVGQIADLTGEARELEEGLETAGGGWLAIAPSGREVTIERAGGESALLLELDERGFWELRPVGAEATLAPLVVAANLDVAESDLRPLDLELFRASVTPLAPAVETPQDEQPMAQDREKRQRLWWWLVLAVLVVLGLESWLAARSSGATRARGPVRWNERQQEQAS